jgi:hypothetical protein
MMRTLPLLLAAALATAILGRPCLAASTPSPGAIGSAPADVSKYRSQFPKTPQHTQYVVEVNRKGQVSKVRSGTHSHDPRFDQVTFGNVVQTFIRRSDGLAISGLYRVSYDYDPKTQLVHRSVALIHAGGVDAAAPGLVQVFTDINRRNAQKYQADLHQRNLQQQLKDQLKKLNATAAPRATPSH